MYSNVNVCFYLFIIISVLYPKYLFYGIKWISFL